MKYTHIPSTDLQPSRIGLGTWAIGGSQWGGTNEKEAVNTIHTALEKGMNLIDTAPEYGFGKAEKLVGKALQSYGGREDIILSTKTGVNWNESGDFFRDSTTERIHKEIEDSLNRLQTDYIDIYQVNWPDTLTPLHETAEALNYLYKQGKIKAIGVSNFSAEQIDIIREAAPLHTVQTPYNLFERDSGDNLLPYAEDKGITTIGYSALCRGLLSGELTSDTKFADDDIRKHVDPKFQQPQFDDYLQTVNELDLLAKDRFGKSVLELALRWNLQPAGADITLWGARKPEQLHALDELWDFTIDEDSLKDIDEILVRYLGQSTNPSFLAPPDRQHV